MHREPDSQGLPDKQRWVHHRMHLPSAESATTLLTYTSYHGSLGAATAMMCHNAVVGLQSWDATDRRSECRRPRP
jgi:hypothetical protein